MIDNYSELKRRAIQTLQNESSEDIHDYSRLTQAIAMEYYRAGKLHPLFSSNLEDSIIQQIPFSYHTFTVPTFDEVITTN